MSVRVLVVDDDPLVRGALTLMMGGREDVVVVGEAADGRECRAAVPRLRPDVVLMDLRMPVLGGLEATRELQRRPDPPRVIVLTTFDADEHVLGAVAAGAEGFLLKDTGPHHILEAVLRVASGEPMLSPTATRSLISQVRTVAAADRTLPARQRLDVLTERERDVALAVGRGMSNAEIARELHLSVPTVKAHVSRLLDKLQSPTASRSRSSSTTPGWCEHPSLSADRGILPPRPTTRSWRAGSATSWTTRARADREADVRRAGVPPARQHGGRRSGEGGLLLRTDPADAGSLVDGDQVTRMEMRGREMDGWLRVSGSAVGTDAELRRWVAHDVEYVRSLPPR